MRTLRLSVAGTVILALLGGLGGAVAAQDEEAVQTPAWVTGQVFVEAEPESVNPVRTTAIQMASDSRLSGTVEAVNSWRSLSGQDDSAIWVGTLSIENGGGSWTGQHVGLRGPASPWVHHMQLELEGQGGYAGLRALLFYRGQAGLQRFDGHIFEGELPPLPTE